MVTLFKSITGGINWAEAYVPLKQVSLLALSLMNLYIVIGFFTTLGIIFVDDGESLSLYQLANDFPEAGLKMVKLRFVMFRVQAKENSPQKPSEQT